MGLFDAISIAGSGLDAQRIRMDVTAENLANADTLKLTFNATSAETITPKVFYCETVQ